MPDYLMKTIATVESPFNEKFGIPRQSGLANHIVSKIVFEPEYRMDQSLIGLERFSHLWLVWVFTKNIRSEWSPTVRPPRLGGNQKLGVFATRSSFRPNPIGLSVVRLLKVEKTHDKGTILYVSGADLMNGTAILDIKPYLPYADCISNASGGFAAEKPETLSVDCSDELLSIIPEPLALGLFEALSYDPRPSYHDDDNRIYGMDFGGYNIRFTVSDKVVTIISIEEL